MLKLLAFILLLAPALQAKVHFINQGVKYHIGDGQASASVDSDFLDTYPVVGEEWIQAFSVSEPDVVKVSVAEVWGVDDCAYCKVMIDIDGREMGRLFEEDNHKSFNTPGPLALRVVPGRTYQLRISTRATQGKVDDMAFQGVSIETDKAAVTFMEPGPVIRRQGQPLPVFRRPQPPTGPCEGVSWVEHWLPVADQGRAFTEFSASAGPVRRQASSPLDVGGFLRIHVQHSETGNGDAVSQYLELLLGEPADGWVLSFGPGRKSPSFGNLKRGGRYGADAFAVTGWRPGEWNELKLARCPDGQARLWVNGSEQRARLSGLAPGPLGVSLRSSGLGLKASEKPL